MIKPEEHIMFGGRDWELIKAYLKEEQEQKIRMLVSATDHDTSNRIRGALSMIQALLSLETAADKAAKRNM
jgi:hypothetical protein